jgi:hypothetical protein
MARYMTKEKVQGEAHIWNKKLEHNEKDNFLTFQDKE